jgi:hypothetical protein
MQLPTQEEIKTRLLEAQERDVLGFEWHEYIPFLKKEDVKEYLKEDVSEEDIDKFIQPLTREHLLKKMHDYMSFAWDKANNCRGISANRSIMHYIAWIFLAGEKEFSEEISKEFDKNYRFYGKPILEKICNHYGWDYKQWDDGMRSDTEY